MMDVQPKRKKIPFSIDAIMSDEASENHLNVNLNSVKLLGSSQNLVVDSNQPVPLTICHKQLRLNEETMNQKTKKVPDRKLRFVSAEIPDSRSLSPPPAPDENDSDIGGFDEDSTFTPISSLVYSNLRRITFKKNFLVTNPSDFLNLSKQPDARETFENISSNLHLQSPGSSHVASNPFAYQKSLLKQLKSSSPSKLVLWNKTQRFHEGKSHYNLTSLWNQNILFSQQLQQRLLKSHLNPPPNSFQECDKISLGQFLKGL